MYYTITKIKGGTIMSFNNEDDDFDEDDDFYNEDSFDDED